MTNKEFEKLQKENEKIRKSIQKGIDELTKNSRLKKEWNKTIWLKINVLINNEIEQERLCNN